MYHKAAMSHKRVGVVADRRTATLFRLVGLKDVYPVDDDKEAEMCLRQVLEESNVFLILVTDRLINKIKDLIEGVLEKKYPLIIPIPSVENQEAIQTDLINDLVKRKAGIEFKLQEI
jgi:vacuolar-type H+-ATPase subunit F/Vma7